jgi:hypothetical protein
MKRTLILGVLGLATSVAPTFGQGFIALDNYTSGNGSIITYGTGSGGSLGTGIQAGWTVGLYYAAGDILGTIAANSAGNGVVGVDLSPALLLGTGAGSTAQSYTSTFNTPGTFFSPDKFQASAASGATVTVVLVAYEGANYDSAAIRGHSAAFTMPTVAGTSPTPSNVGDFMSSFGVSLVPEPATFALAGLGCAAMLVLRRRRA